MKRLFYLGHEDVVDILIRGGANVNATDKYGQSALFQAASKGNNNNLIESVVELSLDN